jgi:hypothetical protein
MGAAPAKFGRVVNSPVEGLETGQGRDDPMIRKIATLETEHPAEVVTFRGKRSNKTEQSIQEHRLQVPDRLVWLARGLSGFRSS